MGFLDMGRGLTLHYDSVSGDDRYRIRTPVHHSEDTWLDTQLGNVRFLIDGMHYEVQTISETTP